MSYSGAIVRGMASPPVKTRRSRAELRELVLDAAVDLLHLEGVKVEPAAITYASVFAHLERTKGIRVTRASVHERIWRNQNDFQLEVLQRAAIYGSTGIEAAIGPALAVIEAESDTDHTVWQKCSEVVRSTAMLGQEASEANGRYFEWLGLTLSLAAARDLSDEQQAALQDAVRQSYGRMTEELVLNYRMLISALGLRLRPGLFEDENAAWDTLTRLGTALSEGASLRTRFDQGELSAVRMSPGGTAKFEDWHPFSIGVLALLSFFMEEAPAEG